MAKNVWADASTRLMKLGILSLASLFFGGSVLILVSINALTTPKTHLEGQSLEPGINRFRYGSQHSLQTWTAITGIGFGLLSYGFQEAYIHLFDLWCSRQAAQSAGLDYGRYLNTQFRAPVTYGFRGFLAFATLRHAISLLTIAASIGYKFGLTGVTVSNFVNLRPGIGSPDLFWQIGSEGGGGNVASSPWLTDYPHGSNKCFLHNFSTDEVRKQNADSLTSGVAGVWHEGPDDVTLAGEAYLREASLGATSLGEIPIPDQYDNYTIRQRVMQATLHEDAGNYTMSRKEDGWNQVVTSGSYWLSINLTDDRAVVAYRLLDGKVQIQWAEPGSWYTDESSNQRVHVVRRLTYELRYAVAEILRSFSLNAMGVLNRGSEARILSTDDSLIPYRATDTEVESLENWLNAALAAKYTDVLTGVSAVLRASMYAWATVDEQAMQNAIRELTSDELPFGPENTANTRRSQEFPFLRYPYFTGQLENGVVGAYVTAGIVFMALGVLSIVTMVVRIYVGPAVITSWTGQHVLLSQNGAITLNEGQGHGLASGYSVAPKGLGRLRLNNLTRAKESESEYLAISSQVSA